MTQTESPDDEKAVLLAQNREVYLATVQQFTQLGLDAGCGMLLKLEWDLWLKAQNTRALLR